MKREEAIKMNLRDRREYILICRELWEFLTETGLEKEDWDGWDKYGKMIGDCPFCEYDITIDSAGPRYICYNCPLFKYFDKDCLDLGFEDWRNAKTRQSRKKYAKIFLEKIKEIPLEV